MHIPTNMQGGALRGPNQRHAASFRDPSGFVFHSEDGILLRQVNRCYEQEYRMLMDSGLYKTLVERQLLVEHQELPQSYALTDSAFRVIKPRFIEFISYPYEWSFAALKSAALLTLKIQRHALNAGMSLKDASGYNVQFRGTSPVFIDTLSFEKYEDGCPWTAYGQFCRHFVAPLLLMSKRDIRLNRLLAGHIDGIPLDLAVSLLPWSARMSVGAMLHVFLHATAERRYADTSRPNSSPKSARVSRQGLALLIDNLESLVRRVRLPKQYTHWTNYYETHSYTEEAFEEKKRTVREFLAAERPRTVWDLGSNTGAFAMIAGELGADTVAFEMDAYCVERAFLNLQAKAVTNVLPLVLDLSNPSSAIGWAHRERQSLAERGPADIVMALALVHHLAIGNNVPLDHIAEFLWRIGRSLIVEFVPKSDPQAKRLLRSRKDIFDNYTQCGFEECFSRRFSIDERRAIGGDGRMLYLLRGMV